MKFKILSLIKAKGITVNEFIHKLNSRKDYSISKTTFYRCLNGKRDWTTRDITNISDVLDIGYDESRKIFFYELVS